MNVVGRRLQEYVSSFERFTVAMRDACTAIRIFHETIVARRPNSITKARYISDSLFFYPPVCDEMDAAAFHCAHRRTRYFRETVLRYCARMHVSTMYPSSIFRNIVRYRRVFYISNVYINIRMEDICIYFLQNLFLFSDNSMKLFIVLYTYIRDWERIVKCREYRDRIGDPISRCIVSRI